MFWKVYAVFYLVLIVLGLPPALNRMPHISPIDLVDMVVFTPVALAGLWSVAFRHISLPTNSWKVLLFVSVFWRAIAVGNAILFGDIVPRLQAGLSAYASRMDPAYSPVMLYGGLTIAFAAGTFLTLPPLIALYRNAYGNENLLRLIYSPMRSRQTVA
jgi:hypothetical protein